MKKIGFDNVKFLELQKQKITEKINGNEKLYIEFGGKIFDDYNAERVLPGYDAMNKVNILKQLSEKVEIIMVISAIDIERNKIRADFGISYDMEAMRLVDKLREEGLYVSAIVITLYQDQVQAKRFANKLKQKGERVFFHKFTKGYPSDIDTIVSEKGYGANPYIETTRPIVVVTAPGPGSGKLATVLSQLYYEYKNKIKASYVKFETFPVWNLPLKHPVNLSYEAATADLKDENAVDPFHFAKYGQIAVNYNRDINHFPVFKKITDKIMGEKNNPYNSPTDFGVNMVGYAISDDEICQDAAKQEIIRRYFKSIVAFRKGLWDIDVNERIKGLMDELNLTVNDRKVVKSVKDSLKKRNCQTIALELSNGQIITGRTKELLCAPAACLLNSLKTLAGIKDETILISPEILSPMLEMKRNVFGKDKGALSMKDVLFALSICARNNPDAKKAYDKIKELRNCEAHSSFIMNNSDEETLRKLKINFTSEPIFATNNLFE